MKINEQDKEALTGFHAITGNVYVSSFFRKGKRKCVETVKCLGDSWEVSEALFTDIEEYICAIYNAKKIKLLTLQEQKFLLKNMLMKTKSLICPSYHRVSQHYFFM